MSLDIEKLRVKNGKLKHEMEHQYKFIQQSAEELEQQRRNFMAEKEKVILAVYYWNLLEIYAECGESSFLRASLQSVCSKKYSELHLNM